MVVSGYSKTKVDEYLKANMAPFLEPYKNFKKMFIVDTTGDFKGKWDLHRNFYPFKYIVLQEFESVMNLRFVRIYFHATTFDRITKDRAAKFVDMLSAIGGTMGLLTGFSIISAVEIVYFSIKIIIKILNDRLNKNK